MHSESVKAMLRIAVALGSAIKEAGSIPSGHLYAMVMPVLSLQDYQQALAILKDQQLVREEPSHLLVWIGSEE